MSWPRIPDLTSVAGLHESIQRRYSSWLDGQQRIGSRFLRARLLLGTNRSLKNAEAHRWAVTEIMPVSIWYASRRSFRSKSRSTSEGSRLFTLNITCRSSEFQRRERPLRYGQEVSMQLQHLGCPRVRQTALPVLNPRSSY